MSEFKSDFLHTLSERGFIHQTSDDQGLDKLFQEETVTAYIGFDPTAASLHAGSLTQIMLLHWLQKTGHRPISLMLKNSFDGFVTMHDVAEQVHRYTF